VSPRLLGTLLALVSAASFGVMPVLTKVVYDDGAGVSALLAFRFSLAAVVLLAIARVRRERLPRGRQLLWFVLLGGVGYVVESACYFAALTRISAGLTALLLYVYPALVVVLAAGASRRLPTSRAGLCVVVASVGTALTIGPVAGGSTTGVLLGLSAALSYAIYVFISSRALGAAGPFATSAVITGSAGAVYDVIALTTGSSLPSSTGAWSALVMVSLVGTVLAVSAFFAALALLGAPDTAVISTFEPVVSVVVAALALGESLTAVQVVGGALVLGAVAVLSRAPASIPLDAA